MDCDRQFHPSRSTTWAIAAVTSVALLALRIWDVTNNSLVLRDQMRDWDLVQGGVRQLPLLGPATHVGGYTIGPAFYWILWLIRVVFGPWFESLPHAGGIGQAVLQSAVDALLLVAVWRRTRSVWLAVAVVVLLATASFDLSFSATIWNPVVGSTLAKCAMALVLLDWHQREPWRIAMTAAAAWMAVHAYTGTIYVAVAVCAAIVTAPLSRGTWRDAVRPTGVVLVVILLLQLPYVWFQVSTGFKTAAMGAVTGSLGQVLAGKATPEIGKSVSGLLHAFRTIQVAPWHLPALPLLLAAAAVIFGVRYRRDVTLLLLVLAPPALAIAGYALFLSGLDDYFYLSLMPSLVLMVTLAVTAWPLPLVARGSAIALCLSALALTPGRVAASRTMNRMPEYGALVRASRALVHRHMPMRHVRSTFRMQPTGDPEDPYLLLGGTLDADAPYLALIDRDGTITYQDLSRR